jgi:hypothetical protein
MELCFFPFNVSNKEIHIAHTMIKIIQGSVLDTNEEYVLQQCDCISTQALHLDADYKKEFPWGDVYGDRTPINGFRNLATVDTRGIPGTIKVYPSGNDEPNVVAMFSQVCPGKPFTGINKAKRFKDDTKVNRLKWFKECLERISELKPKSIAVPNRLGCFRNGANWEDYSDALQEFSDLNPQCYVMMYHEP